MTSGVAALARISGRFARSASSHSSCGGLKPAVITRHGMLWPNTRRAIPARAAGDKDSRNRTSLSPSTRTRPSRRYWSNPDRARPVFWGCGLVMRRSTPPRPATSSSSTPRPAATSRSTVATVTPGCVMGACRVANDYPWTIDDCRIATPQAATRSVWLDECQVAIFAAVQDAHRVGVRVAEDDERLAARLEPQRRILHRHRLDGISRGPDRRRGSRGRRSRDRPGRADPGAVALALFFRPARFQLPRLLLDLRRRLAHRQRPAAGLAVAAQHVIAARMNDQLRLVPVFFLRENDGGRHRAVVQETLDPA